MVPSNFHRDQGRPSQTFYTSSNGTLMSRLQGFNNSTLGQYEFKSPSTPSSYRFNFTGFDRPCHLQRVRHRGRSRGQQINSCRRPSGKTEVQATVSEVQNRGRSTSPLL